MHCLEEADEYIFRIESNDGAVCEVRGSEPAASDAARWYGLVQPGQYTFTAIALCNGFELSRATQPVTVTEAESVLDLPDSLTEIGEEAFAGVDAALVIIPDTCTAIGSRAFAGCANLRYVVLPETVTDIAQDAFDGCDLAEFSRPIE